MSAKIAFGAGCYWGTEKYFVKDFPKMIGKGSSADVYVQEEVKVGFMSPEGEKAMKNPSYRQVCSGTTGHVEVLNVELKEPTEEMMEQLIRFFFMFHDPTTMNRQGNDAGTQYASVIFVSDAQQEAIAKKCIAELQQAIDDKVVTAYTSPNVSTAVVPYSDFYAAHDEYQEYLMNNPTGYCNHRFRFKQWPTKA